MELHESLIGRSASDGLVVFVELRFCSDVFGQAVPRQ